MQKKYSLAAMLPSIPVFCHQPKFVSFPSSMSASTLLSKPTINENENSVSYK